MRRIICLMLILSIISGFCCVSANAGEAQITTPGDGEWLDPYKAITVKWTNPSSDYSYKITIKNIRTNAYLVQNKQVNGTSYTIASNTLDYEEKYIIWVGTYNSSTPMGQGSSVTVSMYADNASQKKYQEADFSYPSNNDIIPYDENLKLLLTGNSDLAYKLTVKDTTTGKTIAEESALTTTSYTIKSSLLTPGHEYKAWVGTYKKASFEKKLLGAGNTIFFKTEESEPEPTYYEEADFSYPVNNDTVDAANKLTIKLSNTTSDLCYRISIVDTTTNKNILRNEIISGNTYSLNANSLEKGKKYKLWVGTYINSSTSDAIGKGKIIYIYTEEEEVIEEVKTATKEAVFSSPENDDIVSYNKDLTIRWEESDIDTYYELTIKDITDNSYITQNEIVSGTSYKIKASKLKGRHEYKAWIGTYSNTSDDKKFIGQGDEIYFSTDGTIPVLVTSLDADLKDKGLVFEYEFTGDDFGYATVVVTDSKGNTIYNEKVYDLNGEILIVFDKLEENRTYTCEIQTYTSDGEQAAYKTQKYTVAKSGFSKDRVNVPPSTLTYGTSFSIKGTITSAYPIKEAKILICEQGNEHRIFDSIQIADYYKKASPDNIFDISDYDSQVKFGSLELGNYSYIVSVIDTMDNEFIAINSDFSVIREPGTYADVPSNHKNYEAIKQLSIDGILEGDDTGLFRPGDSIARAEFVKMLYFAFNLSPVSSRDSRSSFTDVELEHWAYTYIMSALNNQIINGKGDGKFAPKDPVTFEEAAKMLVCIKGWQDTAEQNGGWSGGGYITVANKNDFFKLTSVTNGNYKRNASRADVAQMFYNALNKNTNDVVKADKIYTVNGIKLYAYRFSDGYHYVDTSKAFPAFGGYDIKSKDSNLKGSLQIWDSNITNGGKSLKVDYDFTIKRNSYPPYEFDIKLTQNGVLLANSEYKNYFRKNKIQLADYNDMVLINVHDLAMITNHTIKSWEFVPDPVRNVTIINGNLYSNDAVVRKAQILYDSIEDLGGYTYLQTRLNEYINCHEGAKEAYGKATNVEKVYQIEGFLTGLTITIGSLCAGSVTGVEASMSTTLNALSDKIKAHCDTEGDFVYLLLSNSGTISYSNFISLHAGVDRNTMTRERAIEYLTLYYEAKIDSATILMTFSYFAEKCPEHFGEALLQSAKSAFGPIISALTGNVLEQRGISSMSYDIASFLCGTSSSLLDSMAISDNEILANWAKEVKRLKNELTDALYSEGEQTFDIPGRFV